MYQFSFGELLEAFCVRRPNGLARVVVCHLVQLQRAKEFCNGPQSIRDGKWVAISNNTYTCARIL
jgi:hypothetical protein